MHEDVYNSLHPELQFLCLPFDYTDNKIIYKLYTCDKGVSTVVDSEEEIFNNDFNLLRVILMREQTIDIINLDCELLIELLNSTEHVCKNISSTLKSLMKLAFNYLFLNDYNKVIQILEDILSLFSKNDIHDSVYKNKIKHMDDIIKQKIRNKKLNLNENLYINKNTSSKSNRRHGIHM